MLFIKDLSMKYLSFFKAAFVASLVSLLAACGGGGGGGSSIGSGGGDAVTTTTTTTATTPAPTPPTPFASPAMFLPQGQDKITIALSCTNSQKATSASLVINAAGDLIFSGAPGTSTAVVEIVKIKYEEATYRYIESSQGDNTARAYMHLEKDDARINAGWFDNPYYDTFNAQASISAPEYFCTLSSGSASFSLKREINEARLAATMLKGVNQISNDNLISNVQGTFTGGVAYWDNHGNGLPNGNAAQDAIRYLSLDLSTGVVNTSATPSVPFGTPTNLRLALPTNTSTYGYFNEVDNKGQKGFGFQVLPSIGAQIKIFFNVVGNVFSPSGANF
jgi:hypothetical protein